MINAKDNALNIRSALFFVLLHVKRFLFCFCIFRFVLYNQYPACFKPYPPLTTLLVHLVVI